MGALMRVCLALLIVLIAAAAPVAQTSPRFDVASVRPSSPSQTGDTSIGVRITRSQVQITSLTMKDYLAMAFNVAAKQIAGPDWLGEARFDITAKMPDSATREALPSMLEALLIERFQMKIRREPREFPVYALTLAKGPSRLTPSRLKEPDADAPIEIGGSGSNAGVSYNLGGGSFFTLADNAITATHVTLTTFAETLTYFVDRTVIDATGVKGRYDIVVKLTTEEFQATHLRSAVNAGIRLPPQMMQVLDKAPADPIGPALKAAGLAFDARRAPLDVIVIESMQRTPTEN
jgi:uncharacterized protein (TIGR03435 family)